MKKMLLFLSLIIITSFGCKSDQKTEDTGTYPEKSAIIPKGDIPTLDYTQLKPWLNKTDDKTYVVNFWATWCKPCVKELPYFEKVNKNYKDKNVEVILVSLDFPKKKQSSLVPYVKQKNIKSRVLHFDDTNEQFWIADIAESWSGAIPATLIYNKDKRQFYEQSFTQEELENEIQTFIN
jgi:thiol-disulfide isomerase/thioredoxin